MSDEIQEILRLVRSADTPVAISEIEEQTEIPRRTIQRYLRQLLAEGVIERVGAGRGTRYQPAPTEQRLLASERRDALEAHFALPPAKREPVTYRTEFLEGYSPNRTFYLPAPVRRRLRELGEPASTMPAGTYSRRILNRLLIDLSWNSSRLEGNTYSLLETEELLLEGEEAEDRSPTETQMILNHKAAIEFLVESGEELSFSPLLVRNLHALLSENLLADPESGGRLRRIPVQISGSSYLPLADPHQVAEHFRTVLEKAQGVEDPFEAAFFVLVHVPYLQPFVDVNKRVSRLSANIPFVKRNLYPISFLDVSREDYLRAMLAIYELNEVGPLAELFIEAYEHSAKTYAVIRESLGDPDDFRLRHRDAIKATVAALVRGEVTPSTLDSALAGCEAVDVPDEDRPHFDEVVREELSALHEGSFARFRLRPSEFYGWKKVWEGGR